MPSRDVQDFIAHWTSASASERANSQPFLLELCDLLAVPRPDPHPDKGYFFEFNVVEHNPDGTTSNGRIDLYRRAHFVLESKQFQEKKAEASQLELAAEEAGVIARKKSSQPVRGTGAWDDAMMKARGQAERYVRAIPDDNPPFIIVVDVAHSFEIFADFSQAGKAYLPFPDPRTFRIRLADLADPKIRERLRLIWTDPAALDPAKQSADVTREVSAHLAELAKSLEQAGHDPEVVAQFLTRCLFCMFAEDVELLPKESFTELLNSLPPNGEGFEDVMRQLFREMNTGTGKGISVVLRKKLLHFNGGLFSDDTVLPINGLQLGLLKEAARQNWSSVEPAIFGTLLERALNPDERHQLGAHYTPRAYVERLVLPTVIEPLRAEWENARAAALTQARAGDLKKARAEVNSYHERLCKVTVLDPACGSGNFLYVALQHLKVLEGEVFDVAAQFGDTFKLELERQTVDPHQFLGLEINPRAASIAELVLWIGYLQWHFRLHGKRTPPEPILRAFKNIECRDAVLDYDGDPKPALDDAGKAKTVWDRKSTKTDLVTGRAVPDESKRVPLLTYTNPRPAQWPSVDYIVGNPPFLGNKRMRDGLGDDYVEPLRAAYPDVPESADFVLYWWSKAAELVRGGKLKRFGLITTNSITQTFNRRVVQTQLSATPPLSLLFAIPDHPWVDTAEGAAVRIAMTVGAAGEHPGELLEVTSEEPQPDGSENVSFRTQNGKISADLTVGADVTSAVELISNAELSNQGVTPLGLGFRLTPEDAAAIIERCPAAQSVIRPYAIGKDLVQTFESRFIIDLSETTLEETRQLYPEVYQRVLTTVKPERDAKGHRTTDARVYAEKWWQYAKPRRQLRRAIAPLARYIGTCRTARHRTFVFLPAETVPDAKIVAIALEDASFLGILSSRIHVTWALAAGAHLGVGNDPNYNHSECFAKFPFPVCGDEEKDQTRKLAEELDAHRKRVQAQHGLTLTGLYNVLEKIRAGEKLNDKEKVIHDAGLVSVLKQLHDDLDAAVFAAYGWNDLWTYRQEAHTGSIYDFKTGTTCLLDASPEQLRAAVAKFEQELDAEILRRLVALNAARAAEEKRGIIHYLRPDYQAKSQKPGGSQKEMVLPEGQTKPKGKTAKTPRSALRAPRSKQPWPKKMAERVQVVEAALHRHGAATPAELAAQFSRAKPADIAEILETLVTMGRARQQGEKFTR